MEVRTSGHRRRPGVRPDAPPRRPGAVHPHVRHRDRRGARHRPRAARPRTASRARGYGTVRGMHGRRGAGEAKLVRAAHGAVLDVLVDARPGSPTFGAGGDVPARRRGLPPPLRPAGPAARVPGAHRGRRRLLPHRPAARPGRGPGRRVRRPRPGDRLAGARHRDLRARPHRRLLGRPARRSSVCETFRPHRRGRVSHRGQEGRRDGVEGAGGLAVLEDREAGEAPVEAPPG